MSAASHVRRESLQSLESHLPHSHRGATPCPGPAVVGVPLGTRGCTQRDTHKGDGWAARGGRGGAGLAPGGAAGWCHRCRHRTATPGPRVTRASEDTSALGCNSWMSRCLPVRVGNGTSITPAGRKRPRLAGRGLAGGRTGREGRAALGGAVGQGGRGRGRGGGQRLGGQADRGLELGVAAGGPVVGGDRAPRRRGRRRSSRRPSRCPPSRTRTAARVMRVPSTSSWKPSMPITPPQVRVPTTGPSPSVRMALVTMSPSEPANSSASATTGPRGASLGIGHRAQAPAASSQAMTRRASFSITSCEVCPPRLPRTSRMSPSSGHLGAQVAVEVGPALADHVRHVQVADPAVAELADQARRPATQSW